MVEYTRDGGVIPSGVPFSEREPNAHHEMFGIYRALVLRAIYPDDPDSKSGSRMEYAIKIGGQEYPNAIDISDKGGIFNYREKIRKGVEKSRTGEINEGTLDENTDGEVVWVMFVKGHGDVPLIVGADVHPNKYIEAQRSDGAFDTQEFNGVEFDIDKDSNLTLKQVGRKNPDGSILNPAAVGASIKIGGIGGEIEAISSKGASVKLDPNGSVRIETNDGAYISMNVQTGVTIIASKDGHIITMNSSEVSVAHSSGNATLRLTDDTLHLGGDADNVVLHGKMKAIFDAHIHATVFGPSSPPLPPNTMSLAEASPATSAKAKYVTSKGNV